MTQNETVKHWVDSATRNLGVARDMMKSEHYDWALFLGQLALEKYLKAIYLQKTDEIAPFTHDLVKLCNVCNLDLRDDQAQDLIEITRFHIQARYDEIKYEFYKKATKEYAATWMGKVEEYAIWLQKHF